MPERIYRPRRYPPTKTDHVKAHSYEIPLALFMLPACLLVIASELVTGWSISPTITALHGVVAWSIALPGLIGSVQILAGLFDNSEDLMVGWRRERSGLILSGCSWTIYALAVLVLFPGSVLSWGLALTIALAHGIRLWATFGEEDGTRTAVARHEEAA